EEPVVEPTEEPVVEPTEEPMVEPTEEPVVEPTEEPVVEPTEEPVVEPTEEPVVEPTEEPVVEPTEEPVVEPTEEPVVEPVMFIEGYVLVEKDTLLYGDPTAEEAIGSFTGDSVVYAVAADEEWMWVTFDTEILSAADEAFVEGYVAAGAVTELNADEITFADDLRVWEDKLLPWASYEAAEEEVVEPTEEPIVEPTEEPVVEPTEEPVIEPTAAPTEEPDDTYTDEIPPVESEAETNANLLAAPANLQVIPASHNSVTISWDPVEGAELYKLYRSVGDGSFTFVKNVNETTTGNFNMASDTVYSYKVCAVRTVNGSHELGNFSASVSITLSLLPAPANFRGETLAGGGVDLDWDAVPGAAGYRLYRSINGGSSNLVKSVETNAASNFNLDLTNNTYSYQIAALANINGTLVRGELSDPITFQDRPTPPSNLKAVITSDGAYLSWNAVSNATIYRIYRSIDGGNFTLLKDVSTNWATTSVDLSKTYAYRVVAMRKDGTVTIKSVNSADVQLQHQFTAPQNVILEQLDANRIRVRWDAVEGATYYRIYRSTNGGSYSLLKGLTLTDTANYNLNNKENSYSYQIVAMTTNANGKDIVSPRSEPVTIEAMPDAPQNLVVTKKNNTAVDLSWDPVEGATSYRLYRSIDDAPMTLVKSVYDATSTSNYSLTLSDHFYRYFVAAIVETENTIRRSPYSLSATIGMDMAAPANVVTSKTEDGSLTISWDAVAHATGYVVSLAVNDGEFEVTAVDGAEITYNGLDFANNTYSFKIAATCKLSDSLTLTGAETELFTIKPVEPDPEPEIPEMPAPVWSSLEQTGEGEATLIWNDDGAEGYVITWTDTEDGDYALLGEASETQYVVTDLTVGSTYWFKLAAYATVSGEKVVSENVSEARSITIMELEEPVKTYGDFTYDYTENGTGVVILSYTGSDASVVVPETIDSLPVTVIGDSAFEGNTTLTSIDLPDTIEIISIRAFADCTNLSSMD
ncbi:MAG: PT domain-containing protein, partial [Clostridia bacterium]|nr:PT domain-containing protein [Clostridia bacterium]